MGNSVWLLVYKDNMDLITWFCSAGSKDGCIKLWKTCKNYTVLQPLFSVLMVSILNLFLNTVDNV